MIYLDYAATTPLDPAVFSAMEPFLREHFGNPNSIHAPGRRSRQAMEDARELVASLLNVSSNEIVFTGGGSESNNLAIRGVASARRQRGKHIILSAVEHPSVQQTCEALQRDGFELTVVPVDSYGRVDPTFLEKEIRQDTILVTIIHASNEVGTLQPIPEIAALCRDRRIYLHTDAVQTAGKLPLDLEELGADLLSMSGHKFYGPKGVGALYVRSGTRIHAHITGGGQEKNRRSGTENVAGIVGLATALDLCVDRFATEIPAETVLRDRLLREIPERIPETRITGHPADRLPNHASFCFRGVEGEAVLLALDQLGFAVSAGSACSSGSLEPPHALIAMGIPPEYAHGSLRISLGRWNDKEQIDALLARLPTVIERLRSIACVAPV